MAEGDSIEEILQEFNDLEKEDILACLTFAYKMLQNKSIKPTANEIFA
jgi:uncharacterized protein (DUF433 family)